MCTMCIGIRDNNIRYYGDTAIKVKGKIVLRSINEMIREVNTVSEERRYLKEKFPGKDDLIDARARIDRPGLKKIVAAMKCYYGMNHFRERDGVINKFKIRTKCPRCNEKEM